MPKLSPTDQAFFLLETAQRPMSIGALMVLAPPRGSRGRFADRLVEAMLQRPVGPPFNYRLKPGSIKGLLAVEEDPRMNPATQVRRHTLPKGSDLKGLFKRICDIHVRRLAHDAPIWEMHVFTGLPRGRVALYFKTHHGLIDGIGFIRILMSMVSTRPTRKPRAIWEGMLGVRTSEVPARRDESSGLLGLVGDARRTATDTARLVWRQGLRGLGLGSGLAVPFVTPQVMKAVPSPHRVMAHCVLPLPRVRRIARRSGAKVNDVLLTVLDVAMNRYLEERGLVPDKPLVADMPVALHDHGGTGNRITILQVPMGAPHARPADRLRRILRETQTVKDEVRALSGGSLVLYSIVQHALASTIESLGLGELPMLANAVISNPAGFQQRVYFNGAPVELALPVSVVAHHQVLNITITTYVDDLHVTFIALREAIPDLQRLADYTTAAVAALEGDLAKPRPRQRSAGVKQ